MKLNFLVFSFAILFFSAPAMAQEWMTDYDAAMEKAVKEDKHVLIFFTGSDWCPPCKRIKKDIYTSETFIKYAEDKLVLVLADFPKRAENKLSEEQEQKNKKLASNFNPRGFPTTIMLDTEGDELKRWVGYNPGTPEEYVEKFESAIKL